MQQSILQDIRKKRKDAFRFADINPSAIQKLIVCTYPEYDDVSVEFNNKLIEMLEFVPTIKFVSYTEEESAVENANTEIKQYARTFVQSSQWKLEIVFILTDEESAKRILEDPEYPVRVLLIEIPGIREYAFKTGEGSYFNERMLRLTPKDNKLEPGDVDIHERLAQTAAAWLLVESQGESITSYIDNNEVIRDSLSGFIYDCVDQRMRCDTAQNLSGFLCKSEEETKRYCNTINASFRSLKQSESPEFAVYTSGYEIISRRVHPELPKSFFKRLLCWFSKSYKEAHTVWKCDSTSFKEAVELLLGGQYWNTIFSEKQSVDPQMLEDCWVQRRDDLKKTTLAILTDAVSPNGLLNNMIERIKKQIEEIVDQSDRLKEKEILPRGKKLRDILDSLEEITNLANELLELNTKKAWIGLVKKKLETIIKDKDLLATQKQYHHWLTELGGNLNNGAVKPMYQWDADPIPLPTAAKLTDREKMGFDIDAGMLWLRDKQRSRTGKCWLIASTEYEKEAWRKPSEQKNAIDHVENDSFMFLEGINSAQLILLTVDITEKEVKR